MQATYNDLTIAALGSLTPNFDWSVYLRALLPAVVHVPNLLLEVLTHLPPRHIWSFRHLNPCGLVRGASVAPRPPPPAVVLTATQAKFTHFSLDLQLFPMAPPQMGSKGGV